MKRTLFTEEYELFRGAVRQFVEREVKPHQERWIEQRMVDREIFQKAGQAGFLCTWLPERLKGTGPIRPALRAHATDDGKSRTTIAHSPGFSRSASAISAHP